MEQIPVRRALVSVSDKTGLVEFARALAARGVEIVSTGGTAKALADAGVPVVGISDVTGFPEMLEGRVKTLHPKVHGGILADRDKSEHMATIAEHGIGPIDLVCVNLYPFAQTVARPDVTLEDAIENIDIGGPSMVRSAAKNHHGVAIVVDPADYGVVLDELAKTDGLSLATRKRLAAKAFAQTAAYDAGIANYLEKQYAPEGEDATLPETFRLSLPRVQTLRYGENPHQKAALYRDPKVTEPCIGNAVRRDNSGKEVSFNNLYDLDGALELVKEFTDGPAAAIIKHANPCGCAAADTLAEAFVRAREADTVSAFGGILAVNRPLDAATAEQITGPNNFFECIVAPGYEDGVVETLTTKKKWGANLRLLEVAPFTGPGSEGLLLKQVVGGLLVSTRDFRPLGPDDLKVVSKRQPTEAELAELLFCWRVVKHVKSNAIAISKDRALRGVGAGQMNRVRSVRLAVEQAGEHAKGAVLASDAFFPFPDGPEVAAEAGVTAIIQPGGSVKDQETIDLCDRYGVALVFTGVRHFRH
ncbi:MAG TPA: bifunctional phosphoribosylaminoimidazolecarboxamide formyltransferase/IMP cyclohydrolase [Armatimonadaceae bacterium]|nr:bifunctional phosphoribosylaminoimidazolecarboxamide formyltransferase/IMP cyclohydrolase [Armatimonadaceae bacterium]